MFINEKVVVLEIRHNNYSWIAGLVYGITFALIRTM